MQAENKPVWTEKEVQTFIEKCRIWAEPPAVPWKHQGRSQDGVDCVGLFWCVAYEMGISIPIPRNYSHDPDPRELWDWMNRLFDRVPKADMATGDFLMMRFPDRLQKVPNRHIALKTPLGIVHAAGMFRKVVEHELDQEWFQKIEFVFRMRRA